MAKAKKLTKGQLRRIKANQSNKLSRLKNDKVQWQDEQLGDVQSGTVISRFGQHADVEDDSSVDGQQIFRCNIRRSIDSLVCGDKVLWRLGKEEQHRISGVIEAVEKLGSFKPV